MKRVLFFLAAYLGISAPLSAADKEVKIQVKGMVCSFCGQGLTKKLTSQPEVSKVNVNLERKLIRVNFKEGSSLNDERLKSLIEDAGYNVEKIER